jgi:hypothetical protein
LCRNGDGDGAPLRRIMSTEMNAEPYLKVIVILLFIITVGVVVNGVFLYDISKTLEQILSQLWRSERRDDD